jgi:hypothetical protein
MQTPNRWIAVCISIFLVGSLFGCTSIVRPETGTTTTIVLTRHADRNPFASELNEKGRLRAQALVTAVGNLKITGIYSPNIKRNLDTAEPLATHLRITTTVVKDKSDHAGIINTMLTQHAGEVTLWVGNTSNLEDIYELLGGTGDPPTSYGDLFVMKIKNTGTTETIKSHYGP